ncbi:MAG: hypothetical protein R2880_07720 [Deinococcales bacterium]
MLDHFGKPDIKSKSAFSAWQGHIETLAVLKISLANSQGLSLRQTGRRGKRVI